LFARGQDHIERWCAANDIAPPRIHVSRDPVQFGHCAYYRDSFIHIWPAACATIGTKGRAWSYPGHTIDRTPYGVLAHELGHHVDLAHGAQPGLHGFWQMRVETREKPISGYYPNDNEWFAEMFRLFVTNPDLLMRVRPKTYALMAARWKSVELRPWDVVLAHAPRQLELLRRRFDAALKAKPAPLLEAQ
jgi:hypothetical protein